MLDVGEGRGEEDVVVDEEQVTIGRSEEMDYSHWLLRVFAEPIGVRYS